jgi:hypothetical protein
VNKILTAAIRVNAVCGPRVLMQPRTSRLIMQASGQHGRVSGIPGVEHPAEGGREVAPDVAQAASGDAASGMIVAQTLTDQDADDPSQVGPLLDRIGQVTADGAYDGAPTYQTIAPHGDGIEVVIPPRSSAVPSGELDQPTQRDRHLAMITEQGRLAWQVATGYRQRSLVETTMGRYKTLIGPRLGARGCAAQQTEIAVGVAVLNRMLVAGRPDSVRRQPVIA